MTSTNQLSGNGTFSRYCSHLLTFAALVFFSTNASAQLINGVIATDLTSSASAARLADSATGVSPADSWSHASNPWDATAYPMSAQLDLGSDHRLSSLQYYAGQIPSPATAQARFEYATDASPNSFQPLTTATTPVYGSWSPGIALGQRTARYIRVIFDSPSTRFDLAEIALYGSALEPDVPDGPDGLTPVSIVDVVDESNSQFASRLIDGMEPFGSDNESSWLNPTPWDAGAYPMSAVLQLSQSHALSRLDYFVGNLPQGSDEILFEYSNSTSGDDFAPLISVNTGHQWNSWRRVALAGQPARRIRARFNNASSRFNVSEIRLFAGQGGGNQDTSDLAVSMTNNRSNYTPGEPTRYQINVRNNGPANASGVRLQVTMPSGLINVLWTCSATPGSACPQSNGTDSIDQLIDSLPSQAALSYTVDAMVDQNQSGNLSVTASLLLPSGLIDPVAANNVATDTDTGANGPVSEQPRPAPPGPGIVRAFSSWPGDHLTPACRDLHDRYWVQGPDAGQSADPQHPGNVAYQTWHPAIATHPDTGERCDFGHEHGISPAHAPQDVFDLSGGWPAFGYAARVAGGPRHEDHVGHKVTVARFRASIGNGAGSETLYDAGFECDWLSKIHQGSFSMDAFSNHLHEYYLTLRCFDGLNASGVVDNSTVGTAFSVKVMYTYGEPNKFVESNCSGGQTYSSNILSDPLGNPIMPAMQLTPIGNHQPNHRGFACASGVLWKNLETEVSEVDLWTEFIKIQRNSGQTALTIQPYYIVKNPARIIEGFDGSVGEQPSQVVRTVDLCYDSGGNRHNFTYCADAPDPKPTDWIGWRDSRSPFNGTFRAINFKASHLSNASGPTQFCTTASGHAVNDPPPCDSGNIMQTMSQFNNNWNNGQYTYDGVSGNVAGSIWAETASGERFESTPNGSGGYTPLGLGYEFIIDNREPDDDLDGIADGANIRGEN